MMPPLPIARLGRAIVISSYRQTLGIRAHVCRLLMWHFAAFRCAAKLVAYWANNGHRSALALDGSAANDPQRTSAVHCGNGFDVGFSPAKR